MLHTTPDASVALLVNIPLLRRSLVEVCGEPRPALESRWPSQAASLFVIISPINPRLFVTSKLGAQIETITRASRDAGTPGRLMVD